MRFISPNLENHLPRCFSDFWDAYQKVFATGKHHSVGKDSGETAHVVRWNLTLRQRIARFVRKTFVLLQVGLLSRVGVAAVHYHLQRSVYQSKCYHYH